MLKSLIAWLLCGAVTVPLFADCSVPLWKKLSSIEVAAEFIVSGDFNGDDIPDILGSSATSVFASLNDGTGQLLPVDALHDGPVAGAAVAHDLNGDSALDVLFASGSSLIMIAGKGNGTFDAPVASALALTPIALSVARFGPDDALDVVALDAEGVVAVLGNDGVGNFSEASRVETVPGANGMVVADFDGDGANDVIVSHAAPSVLLQAYYGDPSGTLGAPVAIRSTSDVSGIAAADLTNEGLPDLILHKTDLRVVALIRNLGSRSFGDPLQYGTSRFLRQVAAAELNGDAFLDLAGVLDLCSIWTGTGTGLGTLSHRRSNGANDEPAFCYSTLMGAIALADFDDDGRNDAAVALIRDETIDSIDIHRNICGDAAVDVTPLTPVVSVGQSASVRVYVHPPGVSPSPVGATGEIVIRKGDTELATATLQTGVTAEIPSLPSGEHELTAAYSGDEQFEPAVSEPFTIEVTEATTTPQITVDRPWVHGRSAAIMVRVTSSEGTSPTGTLRLDLDDDWATSGTAPSLTYTGPDTLGEHTLVATYAGDAEHPPSSATFTYVNAKQTPEISLTKPWAMAGAPFELTVRVARSYGGDLPTGTVRLRLDSEVDSTSPISNSYASGFALPALAPGHYQLRITYSGDDFFKAVDTVLPLVVFSPSKLAVDARGNAALGVDVVWGPTYGSVARKLGKQPWSTVLCCVSGGWLDESPLLEQVYVYRMQSYYDDVWSDADIAMRISFTNDPLMPRTPIRAVHMQEILRAVNTVRAAADLGAIDGGVVEKGTILTATLMNTLRGAINEARVALGAVPYPFTRALAPGVTVLANDFQELREAMR